MRVKYPKAAVLLLSGLVACSTPSTVYHTLSASAAGVKPALDVSQRLASLGVGPVTLPTLLDREGMVLRQNATSVKVSDQHLWGGQLEDEFLRALSQQLALRLPSTRVQTIPWELTQTPRYQLVIKVQQFDGILGKTARLEGLWQLQNANNSQIIVAQPFTRERSVQGKTVEAMVLVQSLLVSDLADQIINSIRVGGFFQS